MITKGKQLQVGHDANSSLMGAIMFTNYTELISAPLCTDSIERREERGFSQYPNKLTHTLSIVQENAEL